MSHNPRNQRFDFAALIRSRLDDTVKNAGIAAVKHGILELQSTPRRYISRKQLLAAINNSVKLHTLRSWERRKRGPCLIVHKDYSNWVEYDLVSAIQCLEQFLAHPKTWRKSS